LPIKDVKYKEKLRQLIGMEADLRLFEVQVFFAFTTILLISIQYQMVCSRKSMLQQSRCPGFLGPEPSTPNFR